jgi:hypothetical protein
MMEFTDLPYELLVHVVSFLDVLSRVNTLRCCKRLYQVTIDGSLWVSIPPALQSAPTLPQQQQQLSPSSKSRKSSSRTYHYGSNSRPPPVPVTISRQLAPKVFGYLTNIIIPNASASIKYFHAKNMGIFEAFSDSELLNLCPWLPNVEYVDLGLCTGITDIGIHYMFGDVRDAGEEGWNQVKDHLQKVARELQEQEEALRRLPWRERRELDMAVQIRPPPPPPPPSLPLSSLTMIDAESAISMSSLLTGSVDNLPNNNYNDNSTAKFKSIRCPRIRHLILTNLKITDRSLLRIADCCPDLVELDLSCYITQSRLTDIGLGMIFEKCQKLEKLVLTGCSNITDEAFRVLGTTAMATMMMTTPCSSWSRLKYLDVSGCFHIADATVLLILNYCSELVTLDISYCWRVTDNAFLSLSPSPPPPSTHLNHHRNKEQLRRPLIWNARSIRELSIGYCYHISDRGVAKIIDQLNQLESLNITHCQSISKECRKWMMETMKGRPASDFVEIIQEPACG